MIKKASISSIIIILFSIGCFKYNDIGEYENVNFWIKSNMQFFYYWNDTIPDDNKGDTPSITYFNSLLSSEDSFSYIVDDAQALLDDLNASGLTSGISPTYGQFTGTNEIFVIVEFVYPGTPADSAGIERGDIILRVNNQKMLTSNFVQLFNSSATTVSYSMGTYDEESNVIADANRSIQVSQSDLELDPVVYTNVYNYSDDKIGYLLYGRFVTGENGVFLESIKQTMADFKSQGITDLVIDLRYNPGGTLGPAKIIADALVPVSPAQSEAVFVEFDYNERLTQAFIDEEGPDSENLFVRFSEIQENLGLERVYFLTTQNTASSSELLINGLTPHMDVIQIGEPTFGKYYGSYVLPGFSANPPNNYAIVPVSLKYANSIGTTDFVNGLNPDYEVSDNLFATYPIGDVDDPFLSKAIELITTGSATTSKIVPKPYESIIDQRRISKGNILKVIE